MRRLRKMHLAVGIGSTFAYILKVSSCSLTFSVFSDIFLTGPALKEILILITYVLCLQQGFSA